MKNALLTVLLLFVLDFAHAQKTDNYISTTIDGKEWNAEANGDPHDHDRFKKLKETNSIKLIEGQFSVDCTKEEKE